MTSLEVKVILDFSNGKCSKHKIKKSINDCEIKNISLDNRTAYLNIIKIGIYDIYIHVPYDSPSNWNKFSDFKDFEVELIQPFDIDDDISDKCWAKNNFFGKLKINHLVEMIYYYIRLNELSIFL